MPDSMPPPKRLLRFLQPSESLSMGYYSEGEYLMFFGFGKVFNCGIAYMFLWVRLRLRGIRLVLRS